MAVLRNVPKTFSFEEQRIEINEIAQDLFNLSAGNATFTVDQGSVGTASLSYDNNTGIISYTPPDLSSYLTSFTETDPIFGASPASGITAGNITEWNAAYTWGDHNNVGYLTSLPSHTHDLDTLGDVNITTPADGEALVWNQSAGKWQAQQLVIVGVNQFSVLTASASGGGTLGYNQGTGVFTYAPADLSSFSTFSGSYTDLTNKPTLFSGSYTDLTNQPTIPAAQIQSDWNATSGLGEILNKPTLFSGSYTDLTNQPTLFSGSYTDLTNKPTLVVNINDLNDVDTTGIVGGKILKSTASGTWVIADDDAGSGNTINTLNDIGDVNVGGTITDGHVLKWDLASTKWVAGPDLTSSSGSGIALTDISVLKPNPTASGSGDVTYSSTSGAFTYTPPDLSSFSTFSGSYTDLTNKPTIPTNISSFTNDAGYLTSAVALTDISVVKPNPSASGGGDVTYDSSNGQFTYTPPSIPAAQVQSDWNASTGLGEILNKPTLFSGSYTDLTNQPTIPSNLSDLANVSSTSPNNNEVLKWNGSAWAPAADGGGGGGGSSADPIGTITIWSGSSSNIPTGYQLCDGSASATTELQAIRSNVPDLRDKFIVGANSTYAVDATGGSTDSILVQHFHAGPEHTHGINTSFNISASGTTGTSSVPHTHPVTGTVGTGSGLALGSSYTGDYSPRSTDAATDTSHDHTFSFNTISSLSGNTQNGGTGNTTTVGESGAGKNLPPYYSLCYIIKHTATATASGEDNVQANWNESSSSSDAYIQNKPTLFSGSYTDLTSKPTLFSGSYTDLTSKPTLFSGSYTDLTSKPTIPATLDNLSDVSLGSVSEGKILKYTSGSWSAEDESSGGSGEANVQADWNESSSSSDAYIQNKPTLFSGSYTDLTNQPTIPAAQIQTDWTQLNSSSLDFIKNKPTNISFFTNDSGYLTSADVPSGVPSGTIVMYNGSSAPSGWVVCDGTNSTPDLRDKFILAAGSTYSAGSTGGSADAVVVSHSHGAGNYTTSAESNHTHSQGNYSTSSAGGHAHDSGNMSTSSAGGHAHDSGNFSTDTESGHTHNQSGSGSGTTGNQSANHYHTTSQNITIGGGNHRHQMEFGAGTDDNGPNGPARTNDWDSNGNYNTTNATHNHNFNFTVDTQGVSQNHKHNFNFNIGGNTGQSGGHSHTVSGNTGNTSAHAHNVSGNTGNTSAHTHNVSGTSTGGGGHSHNVSGSSTAAGSSGTGTNLPPYYVLTFIMKS